MATSTSVKINLPTLEQYREIFSSDLRFKENAPIKEMLDRWRAIYSRFLTARYYSYSKGSGDWQPLAISTIEYKIRKGLLLEILRATDQLFETFAAAFEKPQYAEFGILVSFGGGTSMQYPGESITSAEVGMFHQKGGGRLPKREIIVPPNRETLIAMRDDLKQTLLDMYHANT